ETGGYDVTFERDANTLMREPGVDPKLFRYEIQGPHALALMEKVLDGAVPETKFFHMARFAIDGVEVQSLRHGMAGQPGFEIFGPWEHGERVRNAILTAGEEFGLVLVGAKAYSSANLESAWVPSPLPAIFTGRDAERYLEWLPAGRAGSLAGRYAPAPRRQKVTLAWNAEDVAAIQRSMYEPGTPAKFLDLPKARYGLYQMDAVLADGKPVGISHDVGYITGEQVFASLASVDASHAEPGTEVTVVWGEEPNSGKPAVEVHRQVEVRATVQPAPYSTFARENYRKN